MADVASCSPTDLTKVMKGLAFESGLIQAHGEKIFRRTDSFVKSRITQKQGNAEEGLNPREHIEYHFNGLTTDYTQVQSAAANTTANVELPDACVPGQTNTTSLTINNVNNLMCDLPTSVLNAGYNQYTGLQFGAAVETPPECAFNLMRMKHLSFYVGGVRKSFPREMNVAYNHKLEQLAIQFGRTNSVETCGELLVGNGAIPAIPTGTADFGTFMQHAELLRGNGWTGAIVYSIGHSSLQNMIRNHKVASGLTLDSRPFTTDDMLLNKVPGDLVMIGDIGFKISQTPTRGYIENTGASAGEFIRIDPRVLQAGTGAGTTAEYDTNYQRAYIDCNGQQHKIIELSFFIHPDAAHVQPFAAKQIPGVPIDGRFNMEVKLINGAHIECNKDNFKFLFRALHYFKFVPTDPRLLGAIAHCYAPYRRYHHVPAVCDTAAELLSITGPALDNPLDNACCDVVGGADPAVERPVQPTASDPNPANVAGEFVTQCEVDVVPGATTVQVCVERRNGSLGAASITYATADGTAVQPTNYTAVGATVLSWAALESGVKCFNLTIVPVPADTVTKTFTVAYTTLVGATAISGMCTSSNINILPTI